MFWEAKTNVDGTGLRVYSLRALSVGSHRESIASGSESVARRRRQRCANQVQCPTYFRVTHCYMLSNSTHTIYTNIRILCISTSCLPPECFPPSTLRFAGSARPESRSGEGKTRTARKWESTFATCETFGNNPLAGAVGRRAMVTGVHTAVACGMVFDGNALDYDYGLHGEKRIAIRERNTLPRLLSRRDLLDALVSQTRSTFPIDCHMRVFPGLKNTFDT